MEEEMSKGPDFELDVAPAPLPGDADEIVVSVNDTPVLTADVTPVETTVELLGIPIAHIAVNLVPLLGPLDHLEGQLESLSNHDLQFLEFNFDWDGLPGHPARLEVVIDYPSPQQDDITLFSAELRDLPGPNSSLIDLVFPDVPPIPVPIDLEVYYDALEHLDQLV
jgi:hypothetical protein